MYNSRDISGSIYFLSEKRYLHYFIPITMMLLAFAIWLLLMDKFRLDDSFITYRYARNAARGWGLVYNQDDAILSTTAPLYAILLAALSRIIPDFHTLGGLIGTICIGLGGILICALLVPRRIGIWAGVLYILSTPLWLSLGMETPLWIMLVLAAVWLASKLQWALAGLLIGFAIFVRPDAALPGGLLGLAALAQTINQMNTRVGWRKNLVSYVAASAIPVLIFAIWSMLTYGSPLPVTLGAKSAQAVLGITGLGAFVGTFDGLASIVRDLLAQSPLYILVGLLMLAGLSRRLSWPIALIVMWGFLHLLTYAVLRIAPYRWYYVPLLPGVILLAAFGLEKLENWLRYFVGATRRVAPTIVAGFAALVALIAPLMSFTQINNYFESGGTSRVMLPIVDWDVYRQVGEWLNQNTPEDATVGVAEVGQVGFYADRWMTDYLGLLQPEVAGTLKRGDLYSWLAEYAPDYLVFQRFRGVALVLYNYVIENDPWFTMAYVPVAEFDDPRYSSGPATIFQRVISKREMIPQPAQTDYGGLRLVGLAVEAEDESRAFRVRVDWSVVGELPEKLHLAVKILNLEVIPSFDADYHTTNWQGAFSTWHTLVLPESASPGTYPLHVAVGPTGGPYNGQNVGYFEVR
jgi:hypothetical protein